MQVRVLPAHHFLMNTDTTTSESFQISTSNGIGSSELIERIGRFRINRKLILRNTDELLPLFSEMVVVEAQMRWEYDAIEYVALSKRFEKQPQGVTAPMYKIVFSRDQNGKVAIQSIERDALYA